VVLKKIVCFPASACLLALLAGAILSGGCLPAFAAGAQAPPPLRLRGVNLARAKWYASADLPPDTSADRITSESAVTTPTATLRTNPGGQGTLFTIIEIPGSAAMGAELTIGDIDGDDETFFNGTPIGATSGYGVSDTGIPRVYYIPAKLMKEGSNVLAIRLRGTFGRGTFGIRREPITLGFVASEPPANPEPPTDAIREAAGIPEAEARAAIAAADPESSAPEPILRKRPSFGRFGMFFHDGLPAVSDISPTLISNRNAPAFAVGLERVADVRIAAEKGEAGIDGWHKLARVEGVCSKQAVRYTMLQHVFYPGGIITLEQGAVLQLRVLFTAKQGILKPVSEPELSRALGGAGGAGGAGLSAFVAYDPQREASPAVVVVSGAAANVTQADDEVNITISRTGDLKIPARIYVFFPAGLRRFDLAAKPATAFDLAAAMEPAVSPAETFARWLQLGLNVPDAADEYFQVRPADNAVRVYQLARFSQPKGVKAGEPILCLPPQASFARDSFSYPVKSGQTTATGVLAFSGPMFRVLSEERETTPAAQAKSGKKPEDSAGAIRVLSYDLPLPPLAERGILSTAENDDLKSLLNANIPDLPTTLTANGVDALYKGRTQGFQAFSFLSEENRRKLLENSALIVPAFLQHGIWQESVEPLTGMKFWWNYFIEGPYFDRYDQDWGNGLALYGLYNYVKYTGDWELVAKNWEPIERMFTWFTVTDDWEWMRASNGVHGHGTGAGDCMSATYAAALSYAKLAQGAGRTEDASYGMYVAARAAVPALNRFAYNAFADENGFKENHSVVVGFHEGKGFLAGELDRYPWNATSNISGNGVQPENFDLYRKFAPQLLRDYEHTFEGAYPNWMDGTYKYPFATLYRDNSGYITLPHIYLRARLKLDSFGTLSDLLDRARHNSHLWWLAPTVIAEVLMNKLDITVADWGRCAFLGGEVTRTERNRGKVEASFDNKYPPDVVEFAMERPPIKLEVNGGPVPLTDSKFEEGRLRIRLRRPGRNTVTFIY
jgi:hypothetical protein